MRKEFAMKLLNVRLLVSDMNASLAFYRYKLGFTQLFAAPDGEYTELSVSGTGDQTAANEATASPAV